MATVAFHPDMQQMPATTKVKLFALPTPRSGETRRFVLGNPESWAAPVLTKIAEPEVNAAGELPVSIGTGAGELPPGKPGLLAAEVAGVWRYLVIRQPNPGSEPL